MAYIGKSPNVTRVRHNPQSAAPSNPSEGDTYYDDGSVNTEGLYVYKNGSFELLAASSNLNVSTQSTTYTATVNDDVIIATTASAWTLTLYAASGNAGKVLQIKKTSSDLNALTIDGNGSETIDGSTTTTINTQYESITLICDGSNWIIQERSIPGPWNDAGAITVTATSSAPTKPTTMLNDKLRWRRDDNMIEVVMLLKWNSNTGANAGSGDYLFSMPSGISIDTANITVYTTAEGNGIWDFADIVGGGARNFQGTDVGEGIVNVFDSTRVRLSTISTAGNGAIGSSFSPFTATSGTYALSFRVPVSGWKS